MSSTATVTAAPRLADLAAQTSTDRNRAVDAYRAAAMIAVAVGHWLVIAVSVDAGGNVTARNALEVAPQFSILTWVFQVMPLFFAVGGFASAMSLDAHWRTGGRDGDWIVGRLRRLVAPTAVLAATWLALLLAGLALGAAGVAAAGGVGAAIPLWFLANYTIDTGLAPTMLRCLRRRRGATTAGLLTVFAIVEVAHVAGVPWIGHVNWVVGWLLFQMVGFLWRDGSLPAGRRMVAGAAVLWVVAIVLVAVGPWPVSMIHVSGVPFSPTHPPSLALVVFGAAFTATAIAAAPWVTRTLIDRPRAWAAVVGANGVSMSVYLWHFTAAVGASAAFYALGWLPSAEIGTAAWWVQKVPLIGASLLLLVPIVVVVSRVERRALLAPGERAEVSAVAALVLAGSVSAALKLWSLGNVAAATAGMLVLLATAAHLRRT